MHIDYQKTCLETCEIVKVVGAYIRNQAQQLSTLAVENKGTHDFVTQVDKTSEKQLVKKLSELIPESGFIAEEQTSTKVGLIYNWVIDPLDGTTNFIHGLAPFAISVALMEDDEVVIGVVYEINLNECFYAWHGGNAYLNGNKISVSMRCSVQDSLFATGFPYYNYDRLYAFMKTLEYFMENSHGLRRIGSAATDLAYVACGRFEGFYEYGLNPWDVAAGAFIVQQAGGLVSDFKGESNYIFGKEIVSANPYVFEEFLKVIKNIMK